MMKLYLPQTHNQQQDFKTRPTEELKFLNQGALPIVERSLMINKNLQKRHTHSHTQAHIEQV